MKEFEITKVRTELNFNGDIRGLKDFLIKNKDYFIEPPIKESKRDIPYNLRKKIFERDKGKCVKCGEVGQQIDHKIPFCAGGKHSLENLRLLCLNCHNEVSSQINELSIFLSNNGEKRVIWKRQKEV